MKSNAKIKVTNNTNGSLGFKSIDDKQYVFRNKGAFRNVEFYIIEGLYNEYPNYITEGYILLEPREVYEELGIEEELVNKLLGMKQIEELLENETAEKIEEIVTELPKPIKENVAIMAKDKKIDSGKKQRAIKKSTGFDITPLDDEE